MEYIDLGLPSGTLWADSNVGTGKPSDFGDYLYWEEANWRYRLPSLEQWQELESCCTWEWTGKGYIVRGKNGNSIFLPAAGCKENFRNRRKEKAVNIGMGYYFSSTIKVNDEWFSGYYYHCHFNSRACYPSRYNFGYNYRMSVRTVTQIEHYRTKKK